MICAARAAILGELRSFRGGVAAEMGGVRFAATHALRHRRHCAAPTSALDEGQICPPRGEATGGTDSTCSLTLEEFVHPPARSISLRSLLLRFSPDMPTPAHRFANIITTINQAAKLVMVANIKAMPISSPSPGAAPGLPHRSMAEGAIAHATIIGASATILDFWRRADTMRRVP